MTTTQSERSRPRTVLDVLRAGAQHLEANGVEHARPAFEQLAAHVFQCRRLDLYLKFDAAVGHAHLAALREGLKRLSAGEPLQYVIGEADLAGRTFKVDARALIPRPETEILAQAAIECGALWQRAGPRLADVGTGSGCLAVTLALERPDAFLCATDRSAGALGLARENAGRHGVEGRLRFVQCDLLEAFRDETLDAVVSNPPYIATAECEVLPRHIRDHEPRAALDGGADGMEVIRRLIAGARRVLRPGGFLFLEIGHTQSEAVRRLLLESGFGSVEVRKDAGGHDRVAAGVRGNAA